MQSWRRDWTHRDFERDECSGVFACLNTCNELVKQELGVPLLSCVYHGPGHDSGWNWTEKKGSEEWIIPSFDPSFAFVKYGDQPSGSVETLTANPWFWDVM
jgi:hypothetical protein